MTTKHSLLCSQCYTCVPCSVFAPYYRERAEGVSGGGVGLAIVKRLCDKFGWSVVIDSTPDSGTCVRLGFS